MANIKRAVHVGIIIVAVTFVGASAAQIIPAVFAIDVKPVPAAAVGSAENECAQGVRSLTMAVDRATEEAWSPRGAPTLIAASGEPALQAFRSALAPEWEEEARVERACASAREGADAWASLLRLRRAEEQVFLGGLVELVPLRRDVTAHLPANLR